MDFLEYSVTVKHYRTHLYGERRRLESSLRMPDVHTLVLVPDLRHNGHKAPKIAEIVAIDEVNDP